MTIVTSVIRQVDTVDLLILDHLPRLLQVGECSVEGPDADTVVGDGPHQVTLCAPAATEDPANFLLKSGDGIVRIDRINLAAELELVVEETHNTLNQVL